MRTRHRDGQPAAAAKPPNRQTAAATPPSTRPNFFLLGTSVVGAARNVPLDGNKAAFSLVDLSCHRATEARRYSPCINNEYTSVLLRANSSETSAEHGILSIILCGPKGIGQTAAPPSLVHDQTVKVGARCLFHDQALAACRVIFVDIEALFRNCLLES